MNDYYTVKYSAINVIDVDSGLIMRVNELKGKAYNIVQEEENTEIINGIKWIHKNRYVKIIANQLKLF